MPTKYLDYDNLRPPVCIDHQDGSPIKSSNAKRSLRIANKISLDPHSLKKMLAVNLTDDGLIKDEGWDGRHHIHPSRNNTKNSTHFKEYFDKPYRLPQTIAMAPEKSVDPFVQNEIAGTRMPKYSKLSLERDVFGELGWIPNFGVNLSKDNGQRYITCREFFDAPLDYTTEGKIAIETNQKFTQN